MAASQGAEPSPGGFPGHQECAEDGSGPALFAAVIENRAKEVGMAVLDADELRLELSQFVEPGRLYTSTLMHLVPRGVRQVVIVGTAHHEVRGGLP